MNSLLNILIPPAILAVGGMLFIYTFNKSIVRIECRSRKPLFGSLLLGFTLLPCILNIYLPSYFAYIYILTGVTFLLINGFITMALKAKYYATSAHRELHVAEPHINTSSIFTSQTLTKKYYELFFPTIKDPIKIVQISDIHISDCLPMSYFENVIKQVEQEQPEIFVITGDFLDRSPHRKLLKNMLKPIGTHANLFLCGNHDIWRESHILSQELEEMGFQNVMNKASYIQINDTSISFNGYEGPWKKREIVPEKGKNADVHVCLTHTADNIFKLAKNEFDIVFSGHYHGGQWRLPFFGSVIIPSIFGRLFDGGHFMVNKTHLFVNQGIGLAHPAFRLNCPPEITVLEINNESYK
ncbi:MAG: metallophosphoesterase [Kiritimatiellae bacterium]|jgi:predicted MPP superfamily phosphohydrolase|nr:metallophosphoesterase [Kiritimatiellia bacterium]